MIFKIVVQNFEFQIYNVKYNILRQKKKEEGRKERKRANMIKADLDKSIMVKLNNKGKGTSKKLLSEMKRN